MSKRTPNGHSVLVVEDDQGIRQMVKIMLELHGFTVWIADNGQEALEKLEMLKEPPCVVLTDLMMPVMDGFELVSRLPEDQPRCVMSAMCPDSRLPHGTMFIRKPFDMTTIIGAVKSFCDPKKKSCAS